MRHQRSALVGCILRALWLSHAVLPYGEAADDKDKTDKHGRPRARV